MNPYHPYHHPGQYAPPGWSVQWQPVLVPQVVYVATSVINHQNAYHQLDGGDHPGNTAPPTTSAATRAHQPRQSSQPSGPHLKDHRVFQEIRQEDNSMSLADIGALRQCAMREIAWRLPCGHTRMMSVKSRVEKANANRPFKCRERICQLRHQAQRKQQKRIAKARRQVSF